MLVLTSPTVFEIQAKEFETPQKTPLPLIFGKYIAPTVLSRGNSRFPVETNI